MLARTREDTWSQIVVPIRRTSEITVAGARVAASLASEWNFISRLRTGPEACNASDPDANNMGTKWCGAVSRDVLLALTLPNPYSLLAVLASMLPGA